MQLGINLKRAEETFGIISEMTLGMQEAPYVGKMR